MEPCKPEHLPPLCGICGRSPVTRDALGFPWCLEHGNRGELLNRGSALGFPRLDAETHAIWEGASYWAIIAVCAEDDVIWLFLAAIEMIYGQGNEEAV